jgi:hypothetical protein
MPALAQSPMKVIPENQVSGEYSVDIWVDDTVVDEIKAVKTIT